MARASKQSAAGRADLEVVRSAHIASYLAAIDNYAATQTSFEAAQASVTEAAANLLRPCEGKYDELIAVRDALKAAYIAKRAPATDDERKKATDAANMLWSRTVSRAKAGKVAIPEAPQSDAAKAQQAKRQANKEARAKKAYDSAIAAGATPAVAKALAEVATDARKQKTAATKVAPPSDLSPEVVGMAHEIDDDDDLFNAVEWILSDASHRTIFLQWYANVAVKIAKAA